MGCHGTVRSSSGLCQSGGETNELGNSPWHEISEAVKKAIEENPDAKAVLVNNPTYYGICSDLKGIVKLAHANGMQVSGR